MYIHIQQIKTVGSMCVTTATTRRKDAARQLVVPSRCRAFALKAAHAATAMTSCECPIRHGSSHLTVDPLALFSDSGNPPLQCAAPGDKDAPDEAEDGANAGGNAVDAPHRCGSWLCLCCACMCARLIAVRLCKSCAVPAGMHPHVRRPCLLKARAAL